MKGSCRTNYPFARNRAPGHLSAPPMKHLSCLLLSFLLVLAPLAARAQAQASPAYRVVVEITFDEKGVAEDGQVVQSDDPTGARALDAIALSLASQVKQAPRLDAEGKPVKFKARAPFNFPVEDDEGPAAQEAPKPSQRSAVQPAYPEALAAAGIVGGAILEIVIGADGAVTKTTVLRSSHPEFANAAYQAVQQWQFTPAKKDGVAVPSRWRIAVNFSINGKEADWKWRVAPRPSLGTFTVGRPGTAATAPAAAPAASPAEKK